MRKQLFLGTALALFTAAPANATLDVFQTYVGSFGLSTDGAGSQTVGQPYTINAFVPLGATVTAAYLYQSNYDFNAPSGVNPITFDGNALSFGPSVVNTSACCGIASARADVTSIVASTVNGGPGGTYNFSVLEGDTGGDADNNGTDGTALVVVYSLGSLPTQTVAILDGFASVTGDTAVLNFANALDPTAPGFTAEMRLGIGFSCCGQSSTVSVNGTTITQNAGNMDDALGLGGFNGQLITVGGDDDPFSVLLPDYASDHERYNLTPFITSGDTSISVNTANASEDDNIFLAAFLVSGAAGVNEPPPTDNGVPEPSTWAMMLLGFGTAGVALRRKRKPLAALA